MTALLVKAFRKKATLLAAIAATAVLTSACGLSLQSLPKIGGISGPTYPLTATFSNVVNLPANAQVREGAFSIGYVSSITAKDFKAVVGMRIKRSVKLPVGTTAQIRFDTPLGEDYVLLVPPSSRGLEVAGARYLGPGAHIPESETSTAPSVEDLFGALGALLNGGGINQLQTIITQTNATFNGNQAQIRSLLSSLGNTLGAFARNTPAIDQALAAIAQLSRTLEAGSATIVQGIDAIEPAVQVLAGENGQLRQLVSQVGRLASVSNQILDQSARGTVASFQQLLPVLDQLNSVSEELGPALSSISLLEQRTPAVAPGDYLQASINATVEVPPVPTDALPLEKETLDPPDPNFGSSASGIAVLMESGLP